MMALTIEIDDYDDVRGESVKRQCCVGQQHNNNANNNKLVVHMLSGERVEVAYGEEERQMAFWEYLTKRLYPACHKKYGLHWDAEKVSLRGVRFLYNTPPPVIRIDLSGDDEAVVVEEPKARHTKKQQYAFDYENRLLKMGEVIVVDSSHAAVLHGVLDVGGGGPLMGDGYNAYVGNAVEYDSRVECCVCLDILPRSKGGNGLTNFCLSGCKHRFHRKCIGALSKAECPMCRKGFEFGDLVLFGFFKSLSASQEQSSAGGVGAPLVRE
jgi:hypothetical protein